MGGDDTGSAKAEVAALRQEKVALGEAVQELRRQLADLAKEKESFINGGCKQHCCTCKGPSDDMPEDDVQNESISHRHAIASENSTGRSNGAEPPQQPSTLSVEEQVGSALILAKPSFPRCYLKYTHLKFGPAAADRKSLNLGSCTAECLCANILPSLLESNSEELGSSHKTSAKRRV